MLTRVQDDAVPKDKAFQRYAAGVDRALSLFETAFEDWAYYISFLGRLLKVGPHSREYQVEADSLKTVSSIAPSKFDDYTVEKRCREETGAMPKSRIAWRCTSEST